MKVNYVDTSKLDVCKQLEDSYPTILNDYQTFQFNFIRNNSFDKNFKLFKYAHEAGVEMARKSYVGEKWKNSKFKFYKKSHSWYAMQASNYKNDIWEGVLLSSRGKNGELINTPVGDEYFSNTIDALRETDVTSILIGRLPSGRAVPPHRGDKRICRIHLGLIVPDGDVSFTCRGEDRKWETGKCLAFNDFYEHSARNNTEYDRVNLIVDTLR